MLWLTKIEQKHWPIFDDCLSWTDLKSLHYILSYARYAKYAHFSLRHFKVSICLLFSSIWHHPYSQFTSQSPLHSSPGWCVLGDCQQILKLLKAKHNWDKKSEASQITFHPEGKDQLIFNYPLFLLSFLLLFSWLCLII